MNYSALQIKRTKIAMTARASTMKHARVLRRLGRSGWHALVLEAKAQSAQVRYLKSEYPDLVELAS